MANILLEVTVPDSWAMTVLDAFTLVTDKPMTLEIRNDDPGGPPHGTGHWNFEIIEKQAGETNKQFGERVLRELGKAVVRLADKWEDSDRYRDEVAAIAPPHTDIPDEVLE